MKKQEALKYIREKKGFVPYVELFKIYNEDEDIPQEIIDIFSRDIITRPRDIMICSAELAEKINELNEL